MGTFRITLIKVRRFCCLAIKSFTALDLISVLLGMFHICAQISKDLKLYCNKEWNKILLPRLPRVRGIHVNCEIRLRIKVKKVL